MVDNELIRQAAPEYGIRVTPELIDAYIKERFYPQPAEGQQTDPAALEREYRENYRNFLNTSRLTESEYREVVVFQLYRDGMRRELSKRVPTVGEQMEVYWIRLAIEDTEADSLVKDLRDGKTTWEDAFADRNTDFGYTDQENNPGYVGWVPRSAFPRLDPYIFGKDPSKPESDENNDKLKLAQNTISDPIVADTGTYIIRVVGGPETRPINEKMVNLLTDRALDAWVSERRVENDVQMNFDSKWYAWVVDQVRRSLPDQARNVTPNAPGQGIG
jgi:hypothetical protein